MLTGGEMLVSLCWQNYFPILVKNLAPFGIRIQCTKAAIMEGQLGSRPHCDLTVWSDGRACGERQAERLGAREGDRSSVTLDAPERTSLWHNTPGSAGAQQMHFHLFRFTLIVFLAESIYRRGERVVAV